MCSDDIETIAEDHYSRLYYEYNYGTDHADDNFDEYDEYYTDVINDD